MTQPYIHMHPFSPKLSFHPGCHITLSRVPYIVGITNKVLLYSTGNSAQCYGSLDGRGVWGRMDTCVCMTESLHCPPETITTLLIGYACPVAQSCLTLCNPLDCSLPGSSVHRIFQARKGCHFLLQGIFPFRDRNSVSGDACIVRLTLLPPSLQGSP